MSQEALHEIPSSENVSWDFPNSGNSKDDVKREENSGMKIAVQDEESPGKKRGQSGNEKRSAEAKKGKRVGNDSHICAERERRRKMRNLFTDLRNLLPQLPVKADKPTIIDQTMIYIKTLQQILQELQKQKTRVEGLKSSSIEQSAIKPQEQPLNDMASTIGSSSNSLPASQIPVMLQAYTCPNVVLNVCGDQAHISVCAPQKRGLTTMIFRVLEKFNVNVLSAYVFSAEYCNRSMYMIQAQVNGSSAETAEGLTEAYKEAVDEIALWITS